MQLVAQGGPFDVARVAAVVSHCLCRIASNSPLALLQLQTLLQFLQSHIVPLLVPLRFGFFAIYVGLELLDKRFETGSLFLQFGVRRHSALALLQEVRLSARYESDSFSRRVACSSS